MLYLLGVAGMAYQFGLRVSIITSLLSVAAFDYLFIVPMYTFVVEDVKKDLITFSVMFIVGFTISLLTSRLRQQAIAMRLRGNRTQALYNLTRELSRTSDPKELFQAAAYQAHKFFKCKVVVFSVDMNGKLGVAIDSSRGWAADEKEQAVAQWAYDHKKIAGKNTDTMPGSKGIYLPLLGTENTVGVMGIFSQEKDQFTDPEQLHMFEMFANQTALAVEGAELAAAAIKSESDIENERLRNMLLSTFSLDLPRPLQAISAAASKLMDPGAADNASARNKLIKDILDEADRLNKLSQEMTDIIKSEKGVK
jgi:two-component system sensor histidine kinase KdpD